MDGVLIGLTGLFSAGVHGARDREKVLLNAFRAIFSRRVRSESHTCPLSPFGSGNAV